MTDIDQDGSQDLLVEAERWCEDPRLGIPATYLAELPDSSRSALLKGLVTALADAYPGSVSVEPEESAGRPGSSAPLMIPGTRVHISMHSVPKALLTAVAGLGVLWAIGGIPGSREVAATVTASAATSFFDAFTRLTPEQAGIVWYVARKARKDGLCRTADIAAARGDRSLRHLSELKEKGVLREEQDTWIVSF